jgi:hypothetical protein
MKKKSKIQNKIKAGEGKSKKKPPVFLRRLTVID